MGNDRYKDWYLANKDRVNESRRSRYKEDSDLRKKISVRDRDRWVRGHDGRIRERQSKILNSLGYLSYLDEVGVPHVRLVLLSDEIRRVYSLNVLSKVLGVDTWTLRRWGEAEALVSPSLIDDSGRWWFTQSAVEFMFNTVKNYRAENYMLKDFGRVVQKLWRDENGK